MSRLGNLLRLERTRRKLSLKQVARLVAISEKYLADVEAGKRIISDREARRILEKIGADSPTGAEFSMEEIANTVDLHTAAPIQRKVEAQKSKAPKNDDGKQEKVAGSIWLDALSSVIRSVPIYNAAMKEIGRRLLPVEKGKIEGVSADKVFYYQAPDNALQGFRVKKGDLLLIIPQNMSEDGALMLVKTATGMTLRMVKTLPRFQVMLQAFDASFDSEIVNLSDISFVGKAVRLEAEL